MLTASNYSANLKTAAKNAAAALGLTGIAPSDFTLEQRQGYNQALVKQILAYPNSFSAEEVNQAATMNTDYGLRGYYFDSALGTAATSVGDTITKINPLDAANIKTVGMWLLIAGVVLGAVWLFLRRPPRGPSPVHA